MNNWNYHAKSILTSITAPEFQTQALDFLFIFGLWIISTLHFNTATLTSYSANTALVSRWQGVKRVSKSFVLL